VSGYAISVADPEFLSLISDQNFSVPEPGSKRFRILDLHFPSKNLKNLSNFNQKNVSKLSEIWSGMFIPDPEIDFLPIPDFGSRGQKGTGSRNLIRKTDCHDLQFSLIRTANH
jgi:hypothetical protein